MSTTGKLLIAAGAAVIVSTGISAVANVLLRRKSNALIDGIVADIKADRESAEKCAKEIDNPADAAINDGD